MSSLFDFAVYGPDGQVSSVIEVKARGGTTSTWATALRRNLIDQARLPAGAMFVLVTPGALYLWNAGADEDDSPSYEVEAKAFFRPYFERAGVSLGAESTVDSIVFEMIVRTWLQDLATSASTSEPLLDASGFVAQLRNGRIVPELAA